MLPEACTTSDICLVSDFTDTANLYLVQWHRNGHQLDKLAQVYTLTVLTELMINFKHKRAYFKKKKKVIIFEAI